MKHMAPNPAPELTAESGLRALAVPSSLRFSAAAQRERQGSLTASDLEQS